MPVIKKKKIKTKQFLLHKRWPNSSVPGTNFQPWDYNKTFVSCRLGWQNRKTNLNLPKSASLVIRRGNMPMSFDGSPWYTKLRASWWKDYLPSHMKLVWTSEFCSLRAKCHQNSLHVVTRFLEHTMRALYPPQLVNRRQFEFFAKLSKRTFFARLPRCRWIVERILRNHLNYFLLLTAGNTWRRFETCKHFNADISSKFISDTAASEVLNTWCPAEPSIKSVTNGRRRKIDEGVDYVLTLRQLAATCKVSCSRYHFHKTIKLMASKSVAARCPPFMKTKSSKITIFLQTRFNNADGQARAKKF